MKILTAEQIHKLDAHTIENEPIPSIHLMERAAESCVEWLWKEFGEQQYSFLCGTGNNGGDGLAMARHFSLRKYDCEVYVLGDPQKGSDDFKINLNKLEETDCRIYYLNSENHLFTLPKKSLIVDCIFGSGLNRPVEGWRAKIIERLNKSGHRQIAIDIPSGLFADPLEQQDDCCLEADITLTFQVPKRAFLFRENEKKVGRVIVRDIGLDRKFHDSLDSDLEFNDMEWAKSVYRDRSHFSHKGSFGHLVICGGSKGKIGAVTLAAKSALRSGVGLVTALIPEVGYTAFQQSVPTAMCLTSGGSYIVDLTTDIEPEVVALGPGLGTHEDTASALGDFLEKNKTPLVVDADGLNILAKNSQFIQKLPENSVLTPHPKEFDRLFGEHSTGFDRLKTLQEKARVLKLVIVLKGAFTRIALPNGKVFFNSTGNPGMASGGMGDSLTGIIAALMAQGYPADEAAVFGVFIHGKAADLALEKESVESLLAEDLTQYLGQVFKLIRK